MKPRNLLVGVALAGGLLAAAPGWAKGNTVPLRASIAGAGLSRPIVLRAEWLAPWDLNDPIATRPARDTLGPRYEVSYSYRLTQGSGALTVREYLYPYVRDARTGVQNGVYLYVPRGQRFLGRSIGNRWYALNPIVFKELEERGLPSAPPASSRGFPYARGALMGAGFVALLFAGGAFARRSRDRTAVTRSHGEPVRIR